MKEERILKNQIFISIGVAVLIIIGAAAYLFTYFSNFNNYNQTIIENVQKQLDASTKLNYNLFKVINEAEEPTSSSNNIQYYVTIVSQNLNDLQKLNTTTNDARILGFFNHAEAIISITLLEKEKRANINWIAEHEKTVLAFNDYIEAITIDRNSKLAENEVQFNKIKYITIACVIACLAIIIFAIFKFYIVVKNLERSGSELKRLNQELDDVKFNIENTNWVLQNNTLMNDYIRGIDDTTKIGTLVIKTLNELLPLQAATIYIRKPDSYEFELINQTGTKIEETIKVFQIGDGYLGKLAEDKKITTKNIKDSSHLNTSSSLIKGFNTLVFICPLIHDNFCLGIIEAAIEIKDDREIQKLYDFFNRASNTIASKIKFGQSHLLVEQLLLETQRQTEELEAQQEELRITNEELIHKTNLLESSEEELSVQQEELSQTNTELTLKAQELEKRNFELNSAQQIVEQKIKEVELASKYKTEFMANMSHELRTPLNSILILAKLLQDNKIKNLTEEQIKYAGVIYSAGSDLLSLIDDLLDLAKIEAGKIELNKEVINTKSFCNKIYELFNAIAEEKKIDFQIIKNSSSPKEFITDEYRLQQVIKNFLSNAFKFTEKGGNVFLTISMKDNNLYFEVKDTGKGISNEKQKLIFEAFKQEDGSTSRKYGGTGLGLSISKQIASLLEGEITLESHLGVGSTFTIIIPAYINSNEFDVSTEQSPTLIASTPPKTKNDKTKTLLIIEDDINFADTLKTFAEENNFTPYIAHDGLKGIEIANQMIPDAIILDVILPVKDGWEVLRSLKSNSITQHIPIHMMSGTKYDKNELLQKGVISFMHKPVTKDTIQQTFNEINLNQSIKKVLLIEQTGIIDDFIKNSFSKQNILIIQTHSTKDAIEKLKDENDIDTIIINLNHSHDIDFELIENIRQIPHYVNKPIIIYTDDQLPEEEKEKILSSTGPTILKSEKLNSKLLDEVVLFLNNLENQPTRIDKKLKDINTLKGKTVLIADDDMRNIFALSTSLESFDMNIEVANTGKEAIEILKDKADNIDIVLMDIMMPEIDGYEAIKIIRNEMKLNKLPIIAVTAKAMKGDRAKTIEYGANDYISKPVDLNKLISLINVWIS